MSQQCYLGILIDRTLAWLPHIKVISAKAINMLNLFQRNLSDCFKQTKTTAYLSLVRPLTNYKYASCVWDPHYNSELVKV